MLKIKTSFQLFDPVCCFCSFLNHGIPAKEIIILDRQLPHEWLCRRSLWNQPSNPGLLFCLFHQALQNSPWPCQPKIFCKMVIFSLYILLNSDEYLQICEKTATFLCCDQSLFQLDDLDHTQLKPFDFPLVKKLFLFWLLCPNQSKRLHWNINYYIFGWLINWYLS